MSQDNILHNLTHLRHSLERYEVSFFRCILGYNSTYLLNAYTYACQMCYRRLKDRPVNDEILKTTLYDVCYAISSEEVDQAPLANQTKRSQFLDNVCHMLNTPFFEEKMRKSQHDPAYRFMQSLWDEYTEGWEAYKAGVPVPDLQVI